MKSGEVVHQFKSKDGREVILRTPRWEDLDDLTEFINSLVDEGVDIATDQKATREQEADWLGRRLASLEKGEQFSLIAEVDGKVVANSEITKRGGYSKHVGGLGIGIKKGYRDIGIGTEMLKTLLSEAKKMGLKMVFLNVFSTNKRAIHVYEKASFKQTGRRPKFFFKDGKYIDDIIMAKEIQSNIQGQ
ncbi:MAG: N-acetyltransferase family protein [Candidatus Bathyarchaeia archaeon]